MQVWTLKHIATGEWMPSRMGRSTRGWSHWSPGYVHPVHGADKPYDANPRIFFTLQSARNARSAWAQGPWTTETNDAGNWESGPEPYTEIVPGTPPIPRALADLEIVELELRGV